MTPSPLVTGLVTGAVVGLAVSPRHRFSKEPVDGIRLLAGHGVEGDAHAGATVQHRSRKRWRPQEPNLRQVHLIHAELHDELDEVEAELAKHEDLTDFDDESFREAVEPIQEWLKSNCTF